MINALTLIRSGIVFLLLLLGLKWYLAGFLPPSIGHILFLIGIASIVILLGPRLNQNKLGYRYGELILLAVIWFVAILRGIEPESQQFDINAVTGRLVTLGLILALAFIITTQSSVSRTINNITSSFILGMIFYLGLNLAGAIFGLQNNYVESLFFISDDSIFRQRVTFPFASHHREVGFISGLLGVMCLSLIQNKDMKLVNIYVFGLILSIIVLALAGVRSPFIAIFISIFLTNITLKSKKQYILFSIVMMSFILCYLLFDFNAAIFTRNGDIEEIWSLNGRVLIWQSIWNDILVNPGMYIFGYGAFGHVKSELVYSYAWMWPIPERITSHNLYLQILIDMGFVGLYIFLKVSTRAIQMLKVKLKNANARAVKAGFIYILVLGLFDVILYYNTYLFLIFMATVICLSKRLALSKMGQRLVYE